MFACAACQRSPAPAAQSLLAPGVWPRHSLHHNHLDVGHVSALPQADFVVEGLRIVSERRQVLVDLLLGLLKVVAGCGRILPPACIGGRVYPLVR